MSNIFLACEASIEDHPFARRDYERLLQYSLTDEIKKHSVCNDPDLADVIAFIGSSKANFFDITSSALYKKNKNKSVIFYSGDRAIPILPGVYTCLKNSQDVRCRKSLLAGFYLRVTDNDSLDIDENINKAKYLFSFMGSAKNHPVRKQICALKSSRSYLRDSSVDARQQDDGINGENKDRGILYCGAMTDSKFILCPRGIGVSSWRLFETMRAGRVPVIISDDWIAPNGPRWNKFSIRIKENEVQTIPAVLEENEHRAVELGAIARKEWKYWYSKERVFTTVVDQLILAKTEFANENRITRMVPYIQYFDPFFFRHWILSPAKAYIKHGIIKRFT